MDDEILRYLGFVAARPDLYVGREYAEITTITDVEIIQQIVLHERAKSEAITPSIGLVYEDSFLTVLRDPVSFPDGQTGTYTRIIHAPNVVDGAAMLTMFGGKLLLLRHFRYASGMVHLEVPRGMGEAGEDREMTARRELAEEVGGRIKRIVPIGHVSPDTGILGDRIALYFVELSAWSGVDRTEGIEGVMLVPIQAFESLVREDVITDGFTLAAFTKARLLHLI